MHSGQEHTGRYTVSMQQWGILARVLTGAFYNRKYNRHLRAYIYPASTLEVRDCEVIE